MGYSKWPIWGGFLSRHWGPGMRERGLGGLREARIRAVNEGQGLELFAMEFHEQRSPPAFLSSARLPLPPSVLLPRYEKPMSAAHAAALGPEATPVIGHLPVHTAQAGGGDSDEGRSLSITFRR